MKSSTDINAHYADDVALQLFELAGAGVGVSSVEFVHVNSDYVRGPDGICWPSLFTRVDFREQVQAALAKLPGRLPAMRDCINQTTSPHAEPGKQCGIPYDCAFWDRCTADMPVDWIMRLPRLSETRASELRALGIKTITAIPSDFPLTAQQAIIREVIASGQPYVAPDLARLLHGYAPPACYLNFEAMMPAVPLYPGTRPYQTIPFQWSLHAIDADGTLHHREFLATGDEDPRRQFAETLMAAVAGFAGPILVYSSYEHTRLKELAGQFPELRPALAAIIARMSDLLPIVRGAAYFPAFRLSHSLKSVAPALVAGFGYDDLGGIADGGAAAAAFEQLASGAIPLAAKVGRLRAALLAYCRRDTLATVEVHRVLSQLAT